jgi:ATP-dependent DNA helicase RecQ
MTHYDTLEQYFGFNSFRSGQLETIKLVIEDKHDVLTVLPTSTGKTLIYQFLTIQHHIEYPNDITIVVSPLISLMIDQVKSWNTRFTLEKNTIVRNNNSTTTSENQSPVAVLLGSAQTDETIENRAVNGEFPVVYVSPEKLPFLSSDLIDRVHLLVVDECHCISEHGNSFRPSYRTIRQYFPGVRTLALTATAPSSVRDDIIENLELVEPIIVKGCVYRPNLKIQVRLKEGDRELDVEFIRSQCLLYQTCGRCIVFATTRKECEVLANRLGDNASAYHAGLSADERRQVTDAYTTGCIIVATNCFGLGVDFPDIRLIVHYGLPRSFLGYVQECGRAGRDGKLSTCVVIYSSTDISKYNSTERELCDARKMLCWLQNDTLCRQRLLLRYFDEKMVQEGPCVWGSSNIAGCDICMGADLDIDTSTTQFTISDIRLLLTAIQQTGNFSGKRLPIDLLLGSKSKKVKRFIGRVNSVYHNGNHMVRSDWTRLYGTLIKKKLISEVITSRGYVIYKLTRQGFRMI